MIQRNIPPSPGGSKPKTPAQRNLKKVADQLIKKSYSYTKVTYAWLLVNIASLIWGYRHIQYNYASISLSCEGDTCKLEVRPPGKDPFIENTFLRDQIFDAREYSVNIKGDIIEEGWAGGPVSQVHKRNGKGKRDDSIPDFRGWYGSYGIILRENGRDTAPDPHNDELHRLIEKKLSKKRVEMMEKYGSAVMTDPSLIKQLEEHKVDLDKEKDSLADNFEKRQTRKKEYPSLKGIQGLCGDYLVNERDCLFVIRRYNVGSAWRSTLHQVSKIKLYMHGKRDNLHLSEDRKVPMRGIMALVFGFFSLVNCLLLGQFTVPTEDKHSSSQKKQKSRLITIPLGG